MRQSTESLYTEEYYAEKYKSWIDGGLTLNNIRIRQETEKKFNFIKKYMPNTKTALIPGCCFGFLIVMLRESGIDARGFDIAEYAIKNSLDEARPFLKVMNIKNIEYDDNSFDLVAAFDIFEHLYLDEIEMAIDEVIRVAKQNILIRLPVSYYNSDPEIFDYSNHPSRHHAGHVSVYSWDFWVRRFVKSNKFDFWFTSLWARPDEECCEAWITFRSK